MAEPRLITYNGKQYDLDVLRDTVLNNYDTYARLFGYGNNKFKKDYIGLTLILRELESGNAGIETGRIVFNDNFGYDKGDFGKPRNKSKHYTNPAWMILDTVLKMEAYNPDTKKKKLSKSSLNQELTSEIGDVSNLTPLYRIQVQKDAINKLLNKYANIGEDYILDEGFDINEYLNNLRTLNEYLNTETVDDDNYIFHKLGVTNTNKQEETKPSEVKGLEKIIKDLMDSGFYTEDEAKIEALKLLPEYKKKFLENYKKSLGIESTESTSTTLSTATTASQSTSAQSTSEQKTDVTKPSKTSSIKSKNEFFVKFTNLKDKTNLTDDMELALEEHGSEWFGGSGYNGLSYNDGELTFDKNKFKKPYRGRFGENKPKNKNGGKLDILYLKQLKEYKNAN